MNSKKNLIRDSIIVVPFLIFTVVWLVLGLGFQIDFSPAGSYGASMFFNLIFPLSIIGVGAMIYAVTLVVEGRLMETNFKAAEVDRKFITDFLNERGLNIKNVLLMTKDKGHVFVQPKGKKYLTQEV